MATNKTSKKSALKPVPETLKTPKSVYAHTVQMQDDSMAPIFAKGDLLTIDGNLIEEEGDYVLVHSDDLDVIRRYTIVGDRDNYVPENPAYPEMLEPDYRGPESLGPVTSVRRVDGTVESFDLSTRTKAVEWELGEAGWRPVQAGLPKTA